MINFQAHSSNFWECVAFPTVLNSWENQIIKLKKSLFLAIAE